MELTSLKFVVDTSELKAAATELERLGTAVEKLNKPTQQLTKTTEKLNTEQAAVEKSSKKVSEATKQQTSVLERQQMILEFMTQGYSKGQSSQLAYAKAAGALTDEIQQLGKVLQTQRTLMGTDPFDKSIGAMQSLRNEYTVLREVQRLYNADLGLTKTQMQDLAREKLRLIERLKLEGASLTQVKQGLIELNTAYIKNASAENAVATNMRNRQKAAAEMSKANDYIIKELDRVNRLTSENGNITNATNNKLIAFEKALRASGMSAGEQVGKLEAYRKSLESIQKAGGNRQVDYLSRALGPQITDVFVGLATGQSPMMVLLQQGGQLRDQFALAGVAGADMGKMLTQAAASMVTSIKDVALAVGGLLVNAFTAAGKAIVNGFIAPIKLAGSVLYDMATGSNTSASALDALKTSVIALGKVGIFALITGLIAAVVAIRDLIKEQDTASKAANLFGGSLGLTTSKLYEQASAFAGAEGRVGDYISAIASIAKAGTVASDNLKMVTDAVVALSKVGVDADETAKQFAKLGEKPTQALAEFAKQTGLVKPSILETVKLLEQQGKKSEAIAVATKAMSEAMVGASRQIQGEQGYIVRAFNSITSAAKSMWDAILNVGRPKSVADQLFEAESELENRIAAAARTARGPFNRQLVDADTEKLKQRISALRQELAIEQETSKQKAENSKAANAFIKTDEASKKAKDELSKALEYANGLLSQSSGFTADYAEKATQLSLAFKTGRYSIEQQNEAWKQLLSQQPIIKKGIDDAAKAEKERADAMAVVDRLVDRSIGFNKDYTSTLQILNNALLEGWISQQEFNDALTNLNKGQPIIQRLNKSYEELKNTLSGATLSMESQLESLSIERQLLGTTNDEREYRLGLIKAELAYQKELQAIMAKIRTGDLVDPAKITELLQKAAENRQLGINIVNEEESLRSAKKVFEEYTKFIDGVSDALVTALFEGGKAGSKKLRDLIVAELKKPITIVVKAVVDATVGSFIQGAMGGVSGNLTGNAAAALGAKLFASPAVYGAAIGTTNIAAGSQAAMLAAQTGTFGASGALATAQAAGTGSSIMAGAAAAGPYVAAAIAALNALGAFRSTKTVGGGLTGQLGGDLQAYDLTRRSGTMFSGPDYSVRNLRATPETQALNDAFISIRSNTAKMAESLGLSTDKIKDFTMSVGDVKVHPDIDKLGLVLDGLSDEQRVQKINEALTKSSDAMAELVLGAGATMEQLASMYNQVMQERYNLETQLLELQGDIVELRRREREELHESNRALYDQINALKDQKAAAEAAAVAAKSATDDAYSALQRAINAEKKSLDNLIEARKAEASAISDQIKSTESSINTLQSIFDLLENNIRELYREVDATSAMEFRTARAFISRTATGNVVPDEEELANAIESVRFGIDKTYYKTKVDAERDRIILANELSDIQNLTGEQLTNEQRILKALNDQLDSVNNQIEVLNSQKLALDATLENAKVQLDVLRGIDLSVKNLATALGDFTSRIIAESALQQATNAIAYSAAMGSPYNANAATATSQREEEIARIYETVLGRAADVTGLEYWSRSAMSAEEITNSILASTEARIRSIGVEAQNQWIQDVNRQLGTTTDIVARAEGGYTPSGLTLVGEQGPELVNFNRPGMVYTAAQTAGLMGGSSNEELKAIRQELSLLRAEVRADVSYNSKTAKLLDRVIPDGQNVSVTANIDGGAL